jgi:hypothetical protein
MWRLLPPIRTGLLNPHARDRPELLPSAADQHLPETEKAGECYAFKRKSARDAFVIGGNARHFGCFAFADGPTDKLNTLYEGCKAEDFI